jgi:copper chaperone CopZ
MILTVVSSEEIKFAIVLFSSPARHLVRLNALCWLQLTVSHLSNPRNEIMSQTLCSALVATVLLTLVSNSSAAEPAWTSIAVKEMHCAGCAKKIAARLYTVRGVKEVRVDVKKKTMFIAPQQNSVLSPRAMWEAVVNAKNVPIRLAGPSGTFTAKPRF